MINKPISAVWEITMGCNLRCQHCGSSCHDVLPGELSTEEALDLCDEIGELGLQWVTLSGGEPTTRKDWYLIAARLTQNGVVPNMITNGWLFNEDLLDKAQKAGLGTIAFSVDGLQKKHDLIRREGSYQKIMQAMEICRERNMPVTAITTINKLNLGELEGLKEELMKRGVQAWQLQMGFPMGNMVGHQEMVIDPADIDRLIDLAYQSIKDLSFEVILGDCIGYYNLKEIELFKKRCEGVYSRQGCTAGKYTFGILHNGDILGCTSIRDRQYIEGNIRSTPLKTIWENPANFSWNRNLKREDLHGFCNKCRFGNRCLGGCSNTRLTTGGSVYAENQFCSYNHAIKERTRQFEQVESIEQLVNMGRNYAEKGYWQLAENALGVALQRNDSDIDILNLYGYVCFQLGNYIDALEANEKVLQKEPDSVYALKGKGICLARLGNPEEGIAYLKEAVTRAPADYMDPYLDLAVVLYEAGRIGESLSVIEEGRKKSEQFISQSQDLYRQITGISAVN